MQYEKVRDDTIGGQGNLWRMLTPTLERLAIRKIWFEEFRDEMKALTKAKEDGMLPRLKEITLELERSLSWVKRDQDLANVVAMEQLCNDAPVHVKQLYGAPVFVPPSALPCFRPKMIDGSTLVAGFEAVPQAANALPQM